MLPKIKNFDLFCFGLLLIQCKTASDSNIALLEKPNILIIHVDDLGYHDLSCHGSKTYQTPHIDNLEKESIAFSNAYANYPRCPTFFHNLVDVL
jgi:hypothetical protein